MGLRMLIARKKDRSECEIEYKGYEELAVGQGPQGGNKRFVLMYWKST